MKFKELKEPNTPFSLSCSQLLPEAQVRVFFFCWTRMRQSRLTPFPFPLLSLLSLQLGLFVSRFCSSQPCARPRSRAFRGDAVTPLFSHAPFFTAKCQCFITKHGFLPDSLSAPHEPFLSPFFTILISARLLKAGADPSSNDPPERHRMAPLLRIMATFREFSIQSTPVG